MFVCFFCTSDSDIVTRLESFISSAGNFDLVVQFQASERIVGLIFRFKQSRVTNLRSVWYSFRHSIIMKFSTIGLIQFNKRFHTKSLGMKMTNSNDNSVKENFTLDDMFGLGVKRVIVFFNGSFILSEKIV